MGYNTTYDIYIDAKDRDTFKEALEEITHYYPEEYNEILYINGTWYSHEEDLKGLSSTFPDKLITVKGYGEEQPDIWVAYFKNGKSYRMDAQIVFPEFHEGLLR